MSASAGRRDCGRKIASSTRADRPGRGFVSRSLLLSLARGDWLAALQPSADHSFELTIPVTPRVLADQLATQIAHERRVFRLATLAQGFELSLTGPSVRDRLSARQSAQAGGTRP